MNKEKMLQRVEKYLEDNKNGAAYGMYIVKRRVFADDPDDAVYIGDAFGPMSPGRYTTLERFYASLKHEAKKIIAGLRKRCSNMKMMKQTLNKICRQ